MPEYRFQNKPTNISRAPRYLRRGIDKEDDPDPGHLTRRVDDCCNMAVRLYMFEYFSSQYIRE